MCKKLIYLLCLVLVLGVVGSADAQVGKGNILFEYWFGGGIGARLTTLRAHPDFPDNPHDGEWRTIFEGDVNWNNNYGTRVRGYVYPPQTGEYTFWIATDDDGELYLSTDDNPANATLIASVNPWAASREWTKFPEQQSNPITLQAGQKYYIEALQSEGGGGDNIAVAWGGPGIGAGPVVIDGTYLSPWIRPEDLMATNPTPPDGATGVTAPLLSWEAGKTAMWHDVYLGTDPSPPFKARQPLAWAMWFEMAGWTPGVTYYWRIDQVEADNTTIHTGDVWSFTAAPFTAYNPDPADGARFVGTDADLSWSAGSTATSHDVYFGTDETQVTDGTGGTFKGNQPAIGYEPGTLAKDTKYYWRIDEVEQDNTTKYTGDVWSFRTRPEMVPPDPDMEAWYKLDDEGTGTAIDYSGNDRDGTLIGDPEFVPGYYGDAMEFDGDDHVDTGYTEDLANWTITCWVISPAAPSGAAPSGPVHREQNYQFNWNHGNATFRGAAAINAGGWHAASYSPLEANTWYHLAATYDGNALKAYRNGVLITTNTAPSGAASENDSLKLGRHAQAAQYFTGTVDDVRVYSRALTDEEVKETMRGEPDLAWAPNPANGSTTDIEQATPLSWSPGEKAARHDVYFGTDSDAVQDADTTTTGIYRGRQDPNTYTPPEGVEMNQTYYWRIDEYNTDATISEGRVWAFTVAEYLIVDDFEPYDDYCNRIFYTWGDGWGHSGDLTCGVPAYNGNGTGSTVGYLAEPYAEQAITHDGSFQSMPMEYLNDGSTGKALYSETERAFDSAQDWTRHGVKPLTLWFRGYPASDGSFDYDPGTGVYTVTARSGDIWNDSDEFHYAYKRLSGQGEIEVKVLSVDNTAAWAKAGVMIRETLDPNSAYAFMFITPDGRRAFQNRPTRAGDAVSAHSATGAVSAPHWVRLVRQGNTLTAYHSTDGSNWEMQPDNENTGGDASPNPQSIPMAADVYVGLALCSNNTGAICEATFSDLTITGTVTGQWQSQDIGIASNDAERFYVAVEDSTGTAQDVPHPDPNAVQLDSWQEWNIPLVDFAPVDLTKVKKIYIGVGNRNTPTHGGGGMLYIDDIRLYQPRCYPALVKPAGDFNNNCIVDYPDLDIMTDNWLMTDYDVTPVAPSDSNLVANYRFENNLLDSSGNGNHADPCGAPSYVAGQVGYALEFDGIDDGVVTGKMLLSDESEFTLAGWVSAGNPDGSRIGLFGQNDVIEMGFNVGNVSIWTSAAGTTQTEWPFANLTWHHVAAVADATSMTIYFDGQLAVVGAGADNYGSSTFTFNIGGGGIWDASGNWFSGQIDEVSVYSRALSQAEIGSLAGKTTPYTQDLYRLLTPQDSAIDMNSDGTIDLKDYALLADTFLDERLWP